jgi:predicted dehydrogenase
MKNDQANSQLSRRSFHRAAGVTFGAALGFHFIPSRAWGNLEKPALAGIGAGGKGRADIYGSQQSGFQVVALVDIVDAKKLQNINGRRFKSMADVRNGFPDAEFFTDYREMIAKLGDKIDAVTVSTPDHHHFHASALAMQAGKHVYCQKPLTHGIWEARTLARLAKQTGVKTQMGNQAHANDNMRRCVELIRAGVIGKVREVHAWTNRPIWPQGFATAPPKEAVPEGIDWEQWIGPAEWVDYSSKIAPFSWRGWWNFGTGALGDMACHIMDMPYWALLPGAPRSVSAQQVGATELSPPINSKITWEFGPSQYTSSEGFRYYWYDGYVDATFDRESWSLKKASNDYNHPNAEILEGMDFKKFGSVIIGEEGKLFFNRGRGASWVLKSTNPIDGFDWPDESVPRAARQDNYQEWMDAMTGKVDQGESNFGLAGQLTETVLLGVLAQRVPDTKLIWDAAKLEVKGRPDLKKYIQRDYRPGWEIHV